MEDTAEVTLPSRAQLSELAMALRKRSSALASLARAVEGGSPEALARVLGRFEGVPTGDGTALVEQVRAYLVEEKRSRRRRLAAALRTGCAQVGVDLLVLSQEPLELRLPPVSVRIDTDRNQAQVVFADQVLRRCDANADAILGARGRVVAELEGKGWNPGAYLEHLFEAWRRVRGTGTSDWVEIVDVLPEVAWLRQSKRFRTDPSSSNFSGYPRSQMAYDLWRLRRDRTLAVAGWRLSLGPATGGSTKDKARVLRLEDDRGQGQYHLTLRFVKEEPRAET